MIIAIVLFSFCSCNEKRTDVAFSTFERDTTITSDPFSTFTSDVKTSIEKNDKYVELLFSGIVSNINIEKRYYTSIKDSLVFINSGYKGFNLLLHVFLSGNRTILPDNVKNLEISIIYEYQQYQQHFNKGMDLEVVFYTNNTEVKTFKRKIPQTIKKDSNDKDIINDDIPSVTHNFKIPKGANNMKATLYTYDQKLFDDLSAIKNMNDSILAYESRLAYLALNKFEIKIDKKPLEEYIYNHKSPFTQKELDKISLTTNDSLIIDDNVRIVGIGESVHGSATFESQGKEIIKQLIAKGFNMIGFETSIINGIKINDYIKGGSIDIEDILAPETITFTFYNNTNKKELYEYLRSYNKNNNNKISVFGFDIESESESEILIRASEENFAVSKENMFNDYLRNFYETYHAFYNNKAKYKLLFRQRDKVISENIFYIADHNTERDKIILVSHLGHLNKIKSTDPYPSVGYYISEKYGKQYAAIGLFASEGYFLSNHHEGIYGEWISKDFPFSHPIGKSIEQLCCKLDINSFYINNVKDVELLDKILYSRYIGFGYSIMQFSPIDLRKELDIVWFTKISEPSQQLYNYKTNKKKL